MHGKRIQKPDNKIFRQKKNHRSSSKSQGTLRTRRQRASKENKGGKQMSKCELCGNPNLANGDFYLCLSCREKATEKGLYILRLKRKRNGGMEYGKRY